MLTDQDIVKLTNVFASKSDFAELRGDVHNLTELVQGVIVSKDSVAKGLHDLHLEYVGMKHQLNRHERWIHQLADKTEVALADD